MRINPFQNLLDRTPESLKTEEDKKTLINNLQVLFKANSWVKFLYIFEVTVFQNYDYKAETVKLSISKINNQELGEVEFIDGVLENPLAYPASRDTFRSFLVEEGITEDTFHWFCYTLLKMAPVSGHPEEIREFHKWVKTVLPLYVSS